MRRVGGHTGAVTDREHRGRAPVVDVSRREIAQAAVVVRVVVPREEIAAHAAAVFDGAEPIRKLRPVFERAELRFGKSWKVRVRSILIPRTLPKKL